MGLAAAACTASGATADPDPRPSSTTPSTTTSVTSSSTTSTTSTTVAATSTTAVPWRVGATPLPLRPDGFGQVQPTPPVLVDRRLPTTDLLPPPTTGGFESTISPISDEVRARMGSTWHEGCPVRLDELAHLTFSFVGFDGELHTGELVVAATEAEGVISVFERLFEVRFPLEEVRLVTDADLTAPPTGDGNVTAAFVCRTVRGGTRFSAHAYGLAVDVNPFQNPYRRGDLVLPELASAYLDRTQLRPGMIVEGDVVVEAFAAIGWTWGGRWDEPSDAMHFSATGG